MLIWSIQKLVILFDNSQLTIMHEFTIRQEDVKQINTQDAQYLQKGDVVLVRSENVPELGDHYIIVIGPPIQKPHGIRPETITMKVEGSHHYLLDEYNPYNGVVALKLKAEVKNRYLIHHNIWMKEGTLIFN